MADRVGDDANALRAAEIIRSMDAGGLPLDGLMAELRSAEPSAVAVCLSHWVRTATAPERLLSRGWKDTWLWSAVESTWAAPDASPLAALRDESMTWLVIGGLWGRYAGLSFSQAERILRFADDPRLHRGHVRSYRRRILSAVVAAYRMPYVQQRTLQRSGWLGILTEAGEEEFKARNVSTAFELVKEAWEIRSDLPPGLLSSKATVHVATQLASSAAYLRDEDAEERLVFALSCLDEAEDLHLVHGGSPRGAIDFLGLALARENVLRRMSIWGLLPFLDAVERGRDFLVAGLEHFRRVNGLPELADLASGAGPIAGVQRAHYPTLIRALMRLAHCASRAGDWGLSNDAMHAASRFPQGELNVWDWTITAAFEAVDRTQRQNMMEDLLRIAEAPSNIPPRKLWVLLDRSASVARDTWRALYREKLFTTARFWHRISEDWTARSRAVRGVAERSGGKVAARRERFASAADRAEDPAQMGHTVRTGVAAVPMVHGEDSVVGGINAILERVAAGLPLAVILQMYRFGKAMNSRGASLELNGVLDAVAVIDGWAEPRRHVVDKPIPRDESDVRSIQLWFLLSAAELASVYAPHLLPEIHLALTKSPHLDWREKLQHAQTTAEHGRRSGRPNVASAGLLAAVKVALEGGDEPTIATQVDALIEATREGTIWSARGADLVETAFWTGRRIERLIIGLLRSGHCEHAARLFDARAGRVLASFRSQPEFAAELQLMESSWNMRSRAVEDELHRRMRERILEGTAMSIDVLRAGSEHGPGLLGRHEVLVRLVVDVGRSWILLSGWREGDLRHEVIPMSLDAERVSAIADLIWYELRPSRTGKPVTGLKLLHDAVVEPLLERIPETSTILLYPEGVTAALPLHAAEGPNGYLAESHQVAYFPSSSREMPTARVDRSGLVCGWDVSAHAEREAREVARVLRQRGHKIELPLNAIDGRDRLLAQAEGLELVHVSGHGQAVPWPRSFQSSIALSPRTHITAGEWLVGGPRASLVFLNVCGVGRVQQFGGDVNGFPLALRIRGADAVIAATGYIPPAQAHEFARLFYTYAATEDSLAAYHSAVRESIARGMAVAAWAPYAHFGRGYRIGAAPDEAPGPAARTPFST